VVQLKHMQISYAEAVPLRCPRCGTEFVNDTYIIVDAAERPDLVAKIVDGTLHDTRCPNCGETGGVAAPLLYHNHERERVLLAVPPGMGEAEWREVGQTLLWTLIGALPDDARGPYLGNVQAEAGLHGVARVLQQEDLVQSADGEADEELPPIVPAIQALLDAKGAQQLQAAFDAHPVLDDPQAVTILQELAAEAIKHNELEAADGFARAAELLEQVKTLQDRSTARTGGTAAAHNIAPEQVEEIAFALLRSSTGGELAEVVDEHPLLLEPWADALLREWADEQRGADKPRIAEGMDERRAALVEMREHYQEQQPALEAVQAYLQADDDDEIEAVIVDHDALLTDAADQALERLLASARTDGDTEFAQFVEQRRAFLQQVREAIGDE
jgi:hypothetical protein